MATSPPPVQIQKKRGLGCLGCGCALLAVLAILVAALMGFSGYRLYHALKDHTGASATDVPQFDGGDQVLAGARQNMESFQQALEHGQPASLHLNSEQINTLIARDPAFARVRGHLFVTLQGNEAVLQTSLLLGAVESVVFPDRYLNGEATLGLTFNSSDKSVNLDLHTLHLSNYDLPAYMNDSINSALGTILNQKLQANPATRDFLSRVQKLTVENSELVIETQ